MIPFFTAMLSLSAAQIPEPEPAPDAALPADGYANDVKETPVAPPPAAAPKPSTARIIPWRSIGRVAAWATLGASTAAAFAGVVWLFNAPLDVTFGGIVPPTSFTVVGKTVGVGRLLGFALIVPSALIGAAGLAALMLLYANF